jgi:hypothetical protein
MLGGWVRWFVASLAVFSAFGWLTAGILDLVGVFRFSDGLVVGGLVLGVIAGLVAFQGSDRPLLRGFTPAAMGMLGLGDDRVRTGELPSGARALTLGGAVAAAAGLLAAGAGLG